MADIAVKSIGILIDELITTSMKCWDAQDDVNYHEDPELVADAAKKAQEMNARRNQLIRAIDERLGEGNASPTAKTYA